MKVEIAGFALVLGLSLGPVAGVSSAEPPYQGVSPDDGTSVPHRLPGPPGAPVVTLPGFQMRPDGSSVVFIQTGVEPEAKLHVTDGRVVLDLPGLRLPPGNVRRPMDTHFFDTPVTRVALKKRKGGVRVTIDLRAAVQPTLEVRHADSGYYFVTLTFPAGDYR